MRRVRTIVSASDSCSAWPRCRSPVTFGGGCAIAKLRREGSGSALYRPSSSHVRCQRSSTPAGSYRESISRAILASHGRDPAPRVIEDGVERQPHLCERGVQLRVVEDVGGERVIPPRV